MVLPQELAVYFKQFPMPEAHGDHLEGADPDLMHHCSWSQKRTAAFDLSKIPDNWMLDHTMNVIRWKTSTNASETLEVQDQQYFQCWISHFKNLSVCKTNKIKPSYLFREPWVKFLSRLSCEATDEAINTLIIIKFKRCELMLVKGQGFATSATTVICSK